MHSHRHMPSLLRLYLNPRSSHRGDNTNIQDLFNKLISKSFSSEVLPLEDFEHAIQFINLHHAHLSSESLQEAFKLATELIKDDENGGLCMRSPDLASTILTHAHDKIKDNPELIQTAFQNSIARNKGDFFQVEIALSIFQKFRDLLDRRLIQEIFCSCATILGKNNQNDEEHKLLKFSKEFVEEILLFCPEDQFEKNAIQTVFCVATQSGLDWYGEKDIILARRILKNHSDQLDRELIQSVFSKVIFLMTSHEDEAFARLIVQHCPEKLNPNLIRTAFLNGSEGVRCGEELACYILDKHLEALDNKTLIQSAFSKAMTRGKIFLVHALIEQFSDKINPEQVQTLFKDISTNICETPHARSILVYEKLIIKIIENFPAEFFDKELINKVFMIGTSSGEMRSNIIQCLLKNEDFAHHIDKNNLVLAYQNTNSIEVILEIRHHISGSGSWRNMLLPARYDIFFDEQPSGDAIAFEVHNYSHGNDKTVIFYIKEILSQNAIRRSLFCISDLENKVMELMSDQGDRRKAISSLEKLKRDPDYTHKLNTILPAISAFLNADAAGWSPTLADSSAQDRWQLWLKQFLVEAAHAYEGRDSVSCVKGIYERALSGFRTMHSVVDAIYYASNVIQYYFPSSGGGFDPKMQLLAQKSILKPIISNLHSYINGSERGNSFTYLKKLCEISLLSHMHSLESKFLENEYYKEIPDELKTKVIGMIYRKVESTKGKIGVFLENLEDMDLALGTDPNHPILFIDMISKIIRDIDTRRNPISVEMAIDQEIRRVQETIERNMATKAFRDLIQKETEMRCDIQSEQRNAFIDMMEEIEDIH